METFSALLALCVGNSPVTGEFPSQRPVTRSFGGLFDLRLNNRLSKQWRGQWFETPSRSLWRHCNILGRLSSNAGSARSGQFISLRFEITSLYPPTIYIKRQHDSDVIMSMMAFQITSLTFVYSSVYSGADQRKQQNSASLAFVWGIHRWPGNSTHKGPMTRKMFPFDDVIMRMYVIRGRQLVSFRFEITSLYHNIAIITTNMHV